MNRTFLDESEAPELRSGSFRPRAVSERARLILFLLLAAHLSATASQRVRNRLPAIVAGMQSSGRLPAARRLNLALVLPLRNQQALTNLFQQIYDPRSTNFHRYLTPQQFTALFGPTEGDYQTLADFARSNGLVVDHTHPNRTILDVSGPVGDIEKVFRLKLRVYQHPREARTFYAPDVEPTVDLALPLLAVHGLDDYAPPRPMSHVATPASDARPEGGSGPGGNYRGYDFRNAYFPSASLYGLDGSGQSVALVELDGYYAGDIRAYEIDSGLPNVPLRNVLVDNFSGNPSSDAGQVQEVSLDIEMAIAMAPGLSQVIVYEEAQGQPFVDILNAIANDNAASQISCSWGLGSDTTLDQVYYQMGLQGQTFFQASGDDGAYHPGILDFAESPFVTIVGGTTLSTTGGGAWQSETAWNRHHTSGRADATGGGVSGVGMDYAIPAWQENIDMSGNQGSTDSRNIPDVAMVADNVFVQTGNGTGQQGVGGTSVAAPLWAGFMACANQQAVEAGNAPLGFINPTLYALSTSPAYTSIFHDITTGDNKTPSSPDRYSAVPGYDLCTGLGSPNGIALLNALSSFPSGVLWVAFGPNPGIGTYPSPYNALTPAAAVISGGGTIMIKGPGSSTENLTLNRPMIVRAVGGTATIGH